MPELPEVESTRLLLQPSLQGRAIQALAARKDPLIFGEAAPSRLRRALLGATVKGISRRGKHLWLCLDRRPWPCFHLGMTGGFHLYRRPEERPPFWKLELTMQGGGRVAFADARRFGRIRLRQDPLSEPPLAGLGFDPLLDPPGPAGFHRQLLSHHRPVKALLLDQRFAAGVGNWVADETLYQAGIDPRRPTVSLSAVESARLLRVLLRVVRRAVAVQADASRFPRTWLFHHRWGRERDARTARGEPIVFLTVGGRTTAWVPAAQR